MLWHTIQGNEKAGGERLASPQIPPRHSRRACSVGYRPAKPHGYRFLSKSQKALPLRPFWPPRASTPPRGLHFRFIAPL